MNKYSLTDNLLVSSPPSQFESLCTVLLWRPPMEPKGIITGYEIQYSSGLNIFLNSNNPYYKTTDSEQVPELTVQVIYSYKLLLVVIQYIVNAVTL